jgi:hypothetical protein
MRHGGIETTMLSLDELVARLKGAPDQGCYPGTALWIKFSAQRTHKTIEYRTASGNETVHIYLDEHEALVGVEIFS